MLTIDHLEVCLRQNLILDGITTEFAPGQLTAVLGLNGAGKTTLLKTIMGFYRPGSGSVTVDGQKVGVLSPSERAKRLAYVPQKYDGGFQHTAEDFVSMGVTAYIGVFSRPGPEALTRAKETLAELGCGHLIGRSMSRLSGGETRLVYLARAILQDARYLLLDEPAAALDFSRQHQFLTRLRQYVRERQAGAVMTIHDPALAYAYADRILVLHEKRFILDVSTGNPGQRPALAECLRQVYGPETRVDFQGDALRLSWVPQP